MLNQFKSCLNSSVTYVYFLSKFSHNKASILFKKNLAYLIHLATYSKEPNSDCNTLFVQVVLLIHCLHISLIADNFSGGMDTVRSSVLRTMPREVT